MIWDTKNKNNKHLLKVIILKINKKYKNMFYYIFTLEIYLKNSN